MRFSRTCAIWMGASWFSILAHAQLELVPNAGPPCVFSGAAEKIPVIFHNPDDKDFKSEIFARILQADSATVVPMGRQSWKELRVLSGQTVLESAPFVFPSVRAQAKFLVQWVTATNHVIGTTQVLVYPTNLLQQLKALVNESDNDFGVLDPGNLIQPALQAEGIPFVELGQTELAAFSGKLVVVAPCDLDAPEWNGLTDRILALLQKGTPVVWFQESLACQDEIQPSFSVVLHKATALVAAQPALIADLHRNPRSQLNLIQFCQTALHPNERYLANQTH